MVFDPIFYGKNNSGVKKAVWDQLCPTMPILVLLGCGFAYKWFLVLYSMVKI